MEEQHLFEVSTAFANLNPEARAMLVLHETERLSPEEISTVFGVNIETAVDRVRSAVRSFDQQLAGTSQGSASGGGLCSTANARYTTGLSPEYLAALRTITEPAPSFHQRLFEAVMLDTPFRPRNQNNN